MMSAAWISLGTKWQFSHVQAAVNVVISVLGTIAIWTVSRFWWQYGSTKVIKKDIVPLARLYTPGSPGDALDLILLLGKHLFTWRHFPLLSQVIIIIILTAAINLDGPIAEYALRTGTTIKQRSTHGLAAIRGAGPLGNRVSAQVIWNNTIQSLDRAGYPPNQLLDFLPDIEDSWVYEQNEWDPTWQATCTSFEEQPLNITANVNYTIFDALNAFPEFRDTLDPSLFNQSIYRLTVDGCGWLDWSLPRPLKDEVLFVMIQSEPEVDDQLNKNEDPLFISISALRLHDSSLIVNYGGYADRTNERINGTVGNSSYTRIECTFNRKPQVANESMIPWPWTNDTASVAMAFADYYRSNIGILSANNQPISLPSPDELLRLYQVYIATLSTGIVSPMTRVLSITLPTVELSSIFLAFMLLFAILIVVGTIRYTFFYYKHKKRLDELFVPDAKLDWMVHISKATDGLTEEELGLPNREHFQSAIFRRHELALDIAFRRPGRVHSMALPRVHTRESAPLVARAGEEKKGLEVTFNDYSILPTTVETNEIRAGFAAVYVAPVEAGQPSPCVSEEVKLEENKQNDDNANSSV